MGKRIGFLSYNENRFEPGFADDFLFAWCITGICKDIIINCPIGIYYKLNFILPINH